jgi:hypothetical protein
VERGFASATLGTRIKNVQPAKWATVTGEARISVNENAAEIRRDVLCFYVAARDRQMKLVDTLKNFYRITGFFRINR